jgi:hypothetical protein
MLADPRLVCHQSSIGLSRACSGIAAATRSAKFFYAPPELQHHGRHGAVERTGVGIRVHAAQSRRLRSIMAIQDQSQRQHATGRIGIARLRRSTP